jgi:rRNA processing protein Gar1
LLGDLLKKNWVKLNLFYIGQSAKKHQIFRANQWNPKLEKTLKESIFNENYEKIGFIKDIFGPVDMPFISIKTLPNQQFKPTNKLYTKAA